jgi:hypothetical protein
MNKKIFVTIFTIIILISLSGCVTVTPSSIRAAKGTGVARVYAAPENAIWKAMPDVLSELKLKYMGEDKQVGYLLAESDLAVYGYGELIALFIDNPGETLNTRVEVIAKKVAAIRTGTHSGRNWEIDILNKLHEKLKLPADH